MSLLKNVTPEIASDDDAERRVAPRTKTLKRAKVYFNNMNSTFDCIVRNISSTGALLTLDESAHLPREFGVRIGEVQGLRPARLVYRRGMLAGIHFLDAPESEEPSVPHEVEEPKPVSPMPVARSEEIRRIVSEILPLALIRNVRWF